MDNTQILCPICKSSLDDVSIRKIFCCFFFISQKFKFFPMLIQSHVNKTEIISKIIETYFPTEYNERNQLHQEETSRR